ncbi:MAG: hypothetical protein R3202_09910, partial [Candidatus Competibacterales bacterium]|nr:hypothetical protein [Candidatus Competibacterales bacterium]
YFSYYPKDNVLKFLEAIRINGLGTDNYRLNVTLDTHSNLLQRIKKCFLPAGLGVGVFLNDEKTVLVKLQVYCFIYPALKCFHAA